VAAVPVFITGACRLALVIHEQLTLALAATVEARPHGARADDVPGMRAA
jgi:hypothetical protein